VIRLWVKKGQKFLTRPHIAFRRAVQWVRASDAGASPANAERQLDISCSTTYFDKRLTDNGYMQTIV